MMNHDQLSQHLGQLLGPHGWIEDAGGREPYENEWRGYWSGSCLGVAKPSSTSEVAAIVSRVADAGVAIVPHGGNTGLVAGGVPRGGIVVSLERMNRVRQLDRTNHTITVDAGCILASVQDAARDADLYFPLSLGAEGSCRIGGNISTNAGGVAVLRYGNMRDLVMGLEVVLPDGQVWDGLRGLRKDNTGYDLKQVFIGAEGTLGIITGAVLKLFPAIRDTVTAMLSVSSWDHALAVLNRLQAFSGDALSACEIISQKAFQIAFAHVDGLKDPFAQPYPLYVLVEFTSPALGTNLADRTEAELAVLMEEEIVLDAVLASSDEQRAALWRLREAIPEAQPKAGGSIKHDVAVPVSAIPTFVERADTYAQERIPGVQIISFGHLGDGNLHYNLSQPPEMTKDGFLALWDEVTANVHDIAADLGGSFSAEHGVGEIKRGELSRLRDPIEIALMRQIKHALDPDNLMNPGKIIPD